MKCPNCKTEIEDGLIYCPICGKPIQIVPDYNVFDDDLIPSLTGDEAQKKEVEEITGKKSSEGTSGSSAGTKENTSDKKKKKNNSRTKKIVIVFVILFAFMAVLYYFYTNSFSYQYAAGRKAQSRKNYETALEHYQNALEKEPDDVATLTSAGNSEYRLGNEDEAKDYLMQAVKADSTYENAFESLLKIYEKDGDYEAMNNLLEYAGNDKVRSLFEDYLILPPDYSTEGGDYDDDIELTLTPPEGKDYDIFYTTDGSTPDGENGILYTEPIEITEGETTITTVCRNSNGKYGEVTSQTYNIEYVKPDSPVVTPDGGKFSKKTTVTIQCNTVDVDIYYTWDGSDPTERDKQYNGPITVPKGNNILSVIAVDKHGLKSSIVRYSFKYTKSESKD